MPLNDDLSWETTPDWVKNAFVQYYGPPTKDLLPKGMTIYKFNGFATPTRNTPPRPDDEISPWWSPKHAYKHDGGLEQKTKTAAAANVSLREWGRLTSVIKEEWSSLDFILEITLAEDVYGLFGGFKGMTRTDGGDSRRDPAKEGKNPHNKKLPGGATQFYIPNLLFSHVERWSIAPI